MNNTIVSLLGIHSLGPRHNGLSEFYNTIKAMGRKPSVVKCRDDFGPAWEANQLWLDCLTVGAFTDYDGFTFEWDKFIVRARKNPAIRVWEVHNEIDGDYDRQADEYIQLMPRFEAENLGLCMFNSASGAPKFPGEDGGVAYAAIARACAADVNHKHYLGLHGYSSDYTYQLLRYRYLAEYLRQHNALIPIILTEFGPFGAGSIDVNFFMQWCQTIDQELMNDHDIVKGAALWTLGGGWYDFAKALPQLGEYIATVEHEESPPPPPPPPQSTTITITPPIDVRLIRVMPSSADEAILFVPPNRAVDIKP